MAYFYATRQHQTGLYPYEEWEVVTTASTSTHTVPTGNGAGGTVSTEQTLAVTTSATDYSLWEYAWDRYALEARVPAVSTPTTSAGNWFNGTTTVTTSVTYEPGIPVTYGVQAQPEEMLYSITGTGVVKALTDIAATLGWGGSATCEKLFGGAAYTTTFTSYNTPVGTFPLTFTCTAWARSGHTAVGTQWQPGDDPGTAWTTFSQHAQWDTEWQTWTQPLASSAGTVRSFTTRTVQVSALAAPVSSEAYFAPEDDRQVTTTGTLGLEGPQSACVLSTYASTVPIGTRTHPLYGYFGEGQSSGIVTTGTVWKYTSSYGGATAYREYPAWGWQSPSAMGPGEPHYEGLTGVPYGLRVVGVASTTGGVSIGKRAFLAMADYSTVWNGASYTYALDSADAARYSWSSQQPPATSVATGTSAVSALGAVPTGGRPAVAGAGEVPGWPVFTAGAGDTVQWDRGIYAWWTDTDGPAEMVTLTAPVSTVLTAPLQAVFMEYWDVISYTGNRDTFNNALPIYVVRGYNGWGRYGQPRVSPFI